MEEVTQKLLISTKNLNQIANNSFHSDKGIIWSSPQKHEL